MASTLVVGIGSTGLAVIEQAEQFIYEFTGKNKPGNNVECIYLETDTKRLPRRTASGKTSITQVDLSLGSNAVDITQLKNNKRLDASWIPESNEVLKNLNGAGGMPSYGRLALWGSTNYSKFKSEVQAKYQKINGDKESVILVVGSLTGGTGAGLCVDVAYLLRDITKNSNINALFLLPHGESFGTNKSLHENSLSAVAAIDYYTRNKYSTKFPDDVTVADERSPFSLVQYLSQDFNGAKASISTLDELIRVAGVITGLHYMDTETKGNHFFDLISRRRLDSAGSQRIENYITSGFMMVQFPKAQLEELFAIKVSENLLKDLVDPVNYIDQIGNKRKIKGDETNIKNEVNGKIEDLLSRAFLSIDSLDTPKGVNLSQSLSLEAQILEDKSFEQPTQSRFIYDLFSTKVSANYFEVVDNNSSVIRDSIVEQFNDYISALTEQKKNLTITKMAINAFQKHIDVLLKFYQSQYNISGKDGSWDGLLQKHIEVQMESYFSHKISFQSSRFLNYMLQELLNITKIHCSISVLKNIQEHLGSPDSQLKNTQNVTLPNEKMLKQKIALLNKIISSDGSENDYTLNRRRNQLEGYLDGFSSCFKMVYRLGSREEDLREAESNYRRDDGVRVNYNNLFGQINIWNFLTSKSKNLYSEVVRNSVNAIKSLNLFEDSSLEQILKNALNSDQNDMQLIAGMFNSNIQNIRDKIPAMLKLKDDEFSFGEDDCAKLIVLSSDHKKYGKLFTNHTLSPNSDNTCDLTNLDNTIIFYQEYGYMGDVTKAAFNPLKHIEQMKDTKVWVNGRLDHNYISQKVPYLTEEQFKNFLS
jgi:hypothetical protein